MTKPITLAEMLDDPELFTRSKATRCYAKSAVGNAAMHAFGKRVDPEPDRETEREAWHEWYARDQAAVGYDKERRIWRWGEWTLAYFASVADWRDVPRSYTCGPVIREEIRKALAKYGYELAENLDAPKPKDDAPLTRDALLARVSDVLRRSGVEDAGALVRELERRVPREAEEVGSEAA